MQDYYSIAQRDQRRKQIDQIFWKYAIQFKNDIDSRRILLEVIATEETIPPFSTPTQYGFLPVIGSTPNTNNHIKSQISNNKTQYQSNSRLEIFRASFRMSDEAE